MTRSFDLLPRYEREQRSAHAWFTAAVPATADWRGQQHTVLDVGRPPSANRAAGWRVEPVTNDFQKT
jgi:hypothetical protein